ncbi:hypothetical protein FBEOM_7380 [Fusarium beomiforme]|uniref:Uncharacterized protein n=1 Tax=Fusarium beomiforme TaxID=44412 RepID=A0A9P5DY78_9HYPO|nr:hypothetical protein FBEOM_7380 [Fusarium beomiforme]
MLLTPRGIPDLETAYRTFRTPCPPETTNTNPTLHAATYLEPPATSYLYVGAHVPNDMNPPPRSGYILPPGPLDRPTTHLQPSTESVVVTTDQTELTLSDALDQSECLASHYDKFSNHVMLLKPVMHEFHDVIKAVKERQDSEDEHKGRSFAMPPERWADNNNFWNVFLLFVSYEQATRSFEPGTIPRAEASAFRARLASWNGAYCYPPRISGVQ